MARRVRLRPGSKKDCLLRGIEYVEQPELCKTCGLRGGPGFKWSCAVDCCPWPNRIPTTQADSSRVSTEANNGSEI